MAMQKTFINVDKDKLDLEVNAFTKDKSTVGSQTHPISHGGAIYFIETVWYNSERAR